MLAARPAKLTVAEFIREYEGAGERYELIDGVAWAMAGALPRHNLIVGNVLTRLRDKLRGSGCVPFNSDTRLELDDHNIRFPDVAIYCDARDLGDLDAPTFEFPRVVFEVLSPSTQRDDRMRKLLEYQRMDSVEAVVLIDPVLRVLNVFERASATEWRNFWLRQGAPLVLRDPAITLTYAEIFEDA